MKFCKRGHPRTEENTIKRKNGRYHDCRPCSVIRMRERYAGLSKTKKAKYKIYAAAQYKKNKSKSKKKTRDNELKRKYNLTRDEYNNLFLLQNYNCGNLKCDSNLKIKISHVDHNHETGKVRGLLCNNCNMSLGLLKEDCNKLQGLIDYIEKHKNNE